MFFFNCLQKLHVLCQPRVVEILDIPQLCLRVSWLTTKRATIRPHVHLPLYGSFLHLILYIPTIPLHTFIFILIVNEHTKFFLMDLYKTLEKKFRYSFRGVTSGSLCKIYKKAPTIITHFKYWYSVIWLVTGLLRAPRTGCSDTSAPL